MKALLVLLALSMPVFARIGETKEECIKRYGPVRLDMENSAEFEKSGFQLTFRWGVEGKADSAQVEKTPISEKGIGSEISEVEIKTILKASFPALEWESEWKDNRIEYKSSDGSAFATYYKETRYLSISTAESLARFRAKRAQGRAEQVENLKGF